VPLALAKSDNSTEKVMEFIKLQKDTVYSSDGIKKVERSTASDGVYAFIVTMNDDVSIICAKAHTPQSAWYWLIEQFGNE
jgi:hypothetical protein